MDRALGHRGIDPVEQLAERGRHQPRQQAGFAREALGALQQPLPALASIVAQARCAVPQCGLHVHLRVLSRHSARQASYSLLLSRYAVSARSRATLCSTIRAGYLPRLWSSGS